MRRRMDCVRLMEYTGEKMNRDEMTEQYMAWYMMNNADEDEREMRKELECMEDDEFEVYYYEFFA